MAEQATDTVGGTGAVAGTGTGSAAPSVSHGTSEHSEHNPGRPISWAGTTTVVIGFIVGGIAFVPSPHWVIIWIGAAIAVVGLLILAFSKAMNTDWY
ncbi:MAG: HGxxPAAW family protein [Trebonia sp.]